MPAWYRWIVQILLIALLVACGAAPVRATDELDTLERLRAQMSPEDPQRPDLDFRIADTLGRRHDPRALEAYQAIVVNPKLRSYARRDAVLFYYATALTTHGRAGDAIAVLDELITDYPTSRYRPDAFLTLGDTRFDRGDTAGALASYQAASFPPDDERGWYTRYRIAWCHFRLGDTARAADELTAVLQAPPSRSPARAKLVAQARKDLGTLLGEDATYARADALYAAKQFCEAAPLFALVAVSAAANRVEAAYAHVLATLSCEHLADVNPDAGPGQTPLPIPPPWQHAIAAMDLYLAQVAHADERDAVQFKRARILYAFVHFAEAARGFREVLHARDAELAGFAGALLLDCDVRGNGADLAADLAAVCALPGTKSTAVARACPR